MAVMQHAAWARKDRTEVGQLIHCPSREITEIRSDRDVNLSRSAQKGGHVCGIGFGSEGTCRGEKGGPRKGQPSPVRSVLLKAAYI